MAGQIFSGNINALAISWMMIYMLLFAVAWEAWCGFLTERAGENRAQQEMLVKVAKELMILGFIAFGVILLKEFNVFVWNSDTLLTFEFCDLLISICVLICASKTARLRPPPVLRVPRALSSARARTVVRCGQLLHLLPHHGDNSASLGPHGDAIYHRRGRRGQGLPELP